jgi:hypothetical protein
LLVLVALAEEQIILIMETVAVAEQVQSDSYGVLIDHILQPIQQTQQ